MTYYRAALVCTLLILPACTGGKVFDATTGAGINGAKVQVWRVPDGVPDGGWADPSPSTPLATTTRSGATPDDPGLFWFDPNSNTTSSDMTGHSPAGIATGWIRLRIDAPDYEPGIFWRFHRFDQLCRDWSSPDPTTQTPCDIDAYPLVPTAAGNDLLPDMVADVSRLTDHVFQCQGATRMIALTAASANIGLGNLEIEGDGTDAYQNITLTGSGVRKVKIAGQIVYHPQHGHLHYSNWMIYRLIRTDSACQRLPWTRDNDHCVLKTGNKTSTCLEDGDYFDMEVVHTAGVTLPQYGNCMQPTMGVSPGAVDIYDKTLEGQQLDVTGVPPGDYVLELDVDPDRQIIERSHDNNVARLPISIPADCN